MLKPLASQFNLININKIFLYFLFIFIFNGCKSGESVISDLIPSTDSGTTETPTVEPPYIPPINFPLGSKLPVYRPLRVKIGSDSKIFSLNSTGYYVGVLNSDQEKLYEFGLNGTGSDQLSSPLNIEVDATDNVYIADTGNNRIQIYTVSGTLIRTIGSAGTGNGQFNTPTAVTVDSSGNVYVADNGNRRIQKFDSSGTYLTQWGSHGSSNGQFSGVINSIRVAPNGNIFTVESTNRIQSFSSSGVFQMIITTGLSGPQEITFDSSSNIYTFNTTISSITVHLANGNYSTTILYAQSLGLTIYGLDRYSSNGNFLIPISTFGTIVTIDSAASPINSFGSASGNDSSFFNATYLSFNKNLNSFCTYELYITKIQCFDQYGSLQYSSVLATDAVAITLANDSSIFYATSTSIKKISSSGTTISTIINNSVSGSANGQVNNPTVIIQASNGKIYVGDSGNYRVQIFNSDGTYYSKFGCNSITTNGCFGATINDIQFDSSGNIYVLDSTMRLQKFDSSGNFISKFGTSGSSDGQLYNAKSFVIDSTGNFYISNRDNNRIQKFDSTGTYLSKFGSSDASSESYISMPIKIGIDESDKIYVLDYGVNLIRKFDSSGTVLNQ